jgi:phage gpG-like protein
MPISLNWTPNLKGLAKKLDTQAQKITQNLADANLKAAYVVRNQAISNIDKGLRHGRFYKRRTIVHQASAPGEYPKTDTGRLTSSIYAQRVDKYGAQVGTNIEYGLFLEQIRPWLNRTYMENRDKIEKIFNDALRDAIK